MNDRFQLMRGDWGRGMHHDGWDWGWIPMLVVMVAAVALIAWLLASVVRRPMGPPPGFGGPAPANLPGQHVAAPRVSAEEILAERLARGEIEVDDYHRRLEALKQTKPAP